MGKFIEHRIADRRILRLIRKWLRAGVSEEGAVRYADDIVMGFEHRAEAERFLQNWRERLRKFGLELHPDKTRLIEFGRFAAEDRKRRGEGKPETFNFWGSRISARKTGKPAASRSIARLYVSDSQQNSRQ